MKWIVLFTMIICVTSCKKDSSAKDISGKWEARRLYSFYPSGNIILLSGNGNIVNIVSSGATGQLSYFNHDTLRQTYSFKMVGSTCNYGEDGQLQLTDASNNSHKLTYSLKNDTLNLSSSCEVSDGGGAMYVRAQ